MLTKLNCICIIFIVVFPLITQAQDLSDGEKMEDFDYLYTELKDSYPYFEVNKRLHNIDWLSNKEEYQELIKNAKTDTEFVKSISQILNDLNNGHTDMYATIIYEYFYQAYKSYAAEYPDLQAYIEELEKTNQEKCSYWAKLLQEESDSSSETPIEEESENIPNLQYEFDDAGSSAMIKIRSFSYDFIENDKEELAKFFRKAKEFKNLVIDIRGNTGGDDTYWMEHIVPHLIDEAISYPIVFAYKQSSRLKKFKPNYKQNLTVDQLELKNIPKELYQGDFAFRKSSNSILPKTKEKLINSNKYLLVDSLVYSSAESFAYFCKATHFAKIVGERTGGDGIGTDPLILTLPNSGIVVRFTGEMALNPDGSANEEMKTVPDYILENIHELNDLTDILEKIIN